jgi:hypothetical protein
MADPCAPVGAPSGRLVTVRLQNVNGRAIAEQHVDRPWTFTFNVIPGEYTVTAPAEYDHPVTVHVGTGVTTHVQLFNGCK